MKKYILTTAFAFTFMLSLPVSVNGMNTRHIQSEGLGTWAYLRSWIQSPSGLLLHLLQTQQFIPTNKDHLTLIIKTVKEVTENNDITTTISVLRGLEPFANQLAISSKIWRKLHNDLTDEQQAQEKTIVEKSNFFTNSQQDILMMIKKRIATSDLDTLTEQLKEMEALQKTSHAIFLTELATRYKQYKTALILIHTIDRNLEMEDDTRYGRADYCSDYDDDYKLKPIEDYTPAQMELRCKPLQINNKTVLKQIESIRNTLYTKQTQENLRLNSK